MKDLFAIFLIRLFRFFGILALFIIIFSSIFSIIIVSMNIFFDYNYYRHIEVFLFFVYDLFSITEINNNELIPIMFRKLITMLCPIMFLFGFILVYVQIVDISIKDKLKYIIRSLLFMNVKDRKESK